MSWVMRLLAYVLMIFGATVGGLIFASIVLLLSYWDAVTASIELLMAVFSVSTVAVFFIIWRSYIGVVRGK